MLRVFKYIHIFGPRNPTYKLPQGNNSKSENGELREMFIAALFITVNNRNYLCMSPGPSRKTLGREVHSMLRRH